MNPARRLTYRFLSLPYIARIRVAQTLGLLEEDDKKVHEDAELFKRFFRRAQEKKVLKQLWDEVEKYHGEDKRTENPYSRRQEEGV